MKRILSYYYDEILFLREQGKEFAQRHPAIADKIDFNNNRSNDPQTERIIESFAFMAAHLSLKIDDNAESLAYYLLSGLYPWITSVFPPCSIVQFDNKDYNFVPRYTDLQVPTNIIQSADEFGNSYVFRTVYNLTVYPFQITKISINDINELKIDIKTTSVPIEQVMVDILMFYIDASIIDDAMNLYAAMFSVTPKITILINSKRYELPVDALVLCGFEEDESIISLPKFANYSFNLLREVLLFPQKFLFFKILNIDKLIKHYNLNNISEFSVCITLNSTDIKIRENSIRINAVPIVNLFNYVTNSFRFDGMKSRYLLLSNKHPHLAIHSITEMHLIDSQSKLDYVIPHYFNFSSNSLDNTADAIYWLQPLDIEHSTYVSFIDTKMNPANVYADVAYAKTLCINKINPRNILSTGIVRTDGVKAPNVSGKIICQFTDPFWLEQRHSDIWNLLIQLSFGQLSKLESGQILKRLRQITELYVGKDKNDVLLILDNIISIKQFELNKRVFQDAHSSFVKSYTYKVLFKNSKIPAYASLFFKVFERYLQNNRPINSYLDLEINYPNS